MVLETPAPSRLSREAAEAIYGIQKPGKNWTHAVFHCGLQTILLSPKFHCTEEILTIVALLSVDSILYNPPSRRDEVQSVRKKFVSSEGDHLTLLNVYRTFKNTGGNKVGLVLFLFSNRASLWSCVSGHFPFWLHLLKSYTECWMSFQRCLHPEMLLGKTVSAFLSACVSLILNVGR